MLVNKANPVGVALFLCRHFLLFNTFSKMLTSRLKILYVIYPDKILENIKMLWHIKDNLIFQIPSDMIKDISQKKWRKGERLNVPVRA